LGVVGLGDFLLLLARLGVVGLTLPTLGDLAVLALGSGVVNKAFTSERSGVFALKLFLALTEGVADFFGL
jgi:hypothetical protein